jgi:aryl-alcohol dehydrogenase-like predicted oxidoreductase
MDVLKQARDEGKARFLGLGGTTAYEMPQIMNNGNFDVVLSAFQYNLIWREAEQAILPVAADNNMGFVCGSPLHQGSLAAVYENDVIKNPPAWLNPPRRKQFTRIYSLVNDLKITMPELATRFLLSNPQVSTVLSGVRNVAELEKNVESALQGPLAKDVLTEINDIAAMVPFRPYLEPLVLPFKN